MTIFEVQNIDIVNGKLPTIPSGVKDLYCYDCFQLEEIGELPEGLENIILYGCSALKKLPAIPRGVKELYCDSVSYGFYVRSQLEEIGELPEGIEKITLHGCSSLKKLPAIPRSVKWLDYSGCSQLEEIGELPEGIEKITLHGCSSLKKLPAIPRAVKELDCGNCFQLEEIGELPEGLKTIILRGCSSLKKLPVIPRAVKNLDCSGCSQLEEIGELSEGIETIILTGCLSLKKLPAIPLSVKWLDYSGCSQLEEIGELPEGIETIILRGCSSLKKLPAIPRAVKKLDCVNCSQLEEIGELPEGLERISLEGCRSLVFTPDLISRLEILESEGCQISYPSHFNPNDLSVSAKDRLKNLITSYKKQHPDYLFNENGGVQLLLHRFLTEGIGQRSSASNQKGRASEIALSTVPILEVLESRPDLLPFVDELSEGFLSACVNQPVRGWSEISSWMSIAQKEDVLGRLDLAKQILVLDHIVGFVKESKLFGDGVEVEAGNALYREVHNRLKSDGVLEEKWLGVPGPIAYEGMISDNITSEIISDIVAKIKTSVMSLTHEEVLERICEGHHSISWGNVCFAREMREFDENYKKKQQDFLEEAAEKKGFSREDADPSYIDEADWYKFREERDSAKYSKVKELTSKELAEAKERLEESSKSKEKLSKVKSKLMGRISAAATSEDVLSYEDEVPPSTITGHANRFRNVVNDARRGSSDVNGNGLGG
jgi:hypothetical protein